MTHDLFDEVLSLEDNFYEEGYNLGVEDGEMVGREEGERFGFQKGYEKALSMGLLAGHAAVWEARLPLSDSTKEDQHFSSLALENSPIYAAQTTEATTNELAFPNPGSYLGPLPDNTRLRKHIKDLVTLTDIETVPRDNTDASISDFDDRLIKATAKAKIIANILGETLNPAFDGQGAGIEESAGLSARH